MTDPKNVETVWFVIGVIIALTSGIALNVGNLVQKKAVNVLLKNKYKKLKREGAVDIKTKDISLGLKDLGTDKLWLFGFIFQAVVGSALFVAAENMIGPTLTPLLGSFGLVVLVFASCIVQEKLTWEEYLGLAILLGAVVLLFFSKMTINLDHVNFEEKSFLIRVIIYTIAVGAICAACKVYSFRKDRFEGIALATLSGMLVALQNYWISPFTSYTVAVFSVAQRQHPFHVFDVIYFLISIGLVIYSNLQTVYERQLAFRVGTAATVIPISHIPSHLSSVVIYVYVYGLSTTPLSLVYICLGILLLIISSFIFAKRAAYFESDDKSTNMEEVSPLINSTNADRTDVEKANL